MTQERDHKRAADQAVLRPSPEQRVLIRPAEPTDLDAMFAIEQDRHGESAWSHKQLAEELARVSESRWYGVAVVSGETVGYVGLFLSPPEADVQTVTVARAASGRGIGRALLAEALKVAANARCGRLFLEVRADNEAALRLYQGFGFERLGVRRNYYRGGGDALNMRLRLSSTAIQEVSGG